MRTPLLGAAFAIALTACGRIATAELPSILPLLNAAEIPLALSPSGSIRLSDGTFEEPMSVGSATRLMAWLDDPVASGDLDGDGDLDAAGILLVDPGGSGTFRYLVAFLNEAGAPRTLPPTLLGDRIEVEDVEILNGSIVVSLLGRAEGEPLASTPSIRSVLKYTFSESGLVPAE